MEYLLFFPVLFFSVILHEYCHGYVAYKNGDDTAYLMGRLTFNPLPHIDTAGTIVIPAICVILKLPVMIGWAKPVPVNYLRLRNPKRDMAKVAAAGPASNITLALLAMLLLKITFSAGIQPGVLSISFGYAVKINLILAIFNLAPIPPLDGSRIVSWLLPRELSYKYLALERYGMLFVIVLLFSGIFNSVIVPVYYMCLKFLFFIFGVPYEYLLYR